MNSGLEIGEGKAIEELGEHAKTALNEKTLAASVAEKTGGAGNMFTRAYQRAGTMLSHGVDGNAKAVSGAKLRVGGGAAVALGGIVLGAKNMARGVAGYENPETGEHEDASFGKVAFGAAQAVGGTALGALAATGRVMR